MTAGECKGVCSRVGASLVDDHDMNRRGGVGLAVVHRLLQVGQLDSLTRAWDRGMDTLLSVDNVELLNVDKARRLIALDS